MLDEVLVALHHERIHLLMDGTVGLGGHLGALLAAMPHLQAIAVDRDAQNLAAAREHTKAFEGRVEFFVSSYADVLDDMALQGRTIDALLLDLGISSVHIDTPERGFSFRFDAPLDMRFDTSRGKPASTVLARMSERELAAMLDNYGEMPAAMKLAGAMARAAQQGRLETTNDLAAVAEAVYGWRGRKMLPQLFQAVRIATNDELEHLHRTLQLLPTVLSPGGIAAIITFHSLEDRMVKHFFRECPQLEPLTKKPIDPTEAEIAANPRARSAHLRLARRLPS